MRRHAVILPILAALVSCADARGARAQNSDTSSLVIASVTVIDVRAGRRLSDQSVVVAGGHIREVGPARHVRPPAGARRVEGRGRYLIPGLWDMHTHVCGDSTTLRTAPLLLIAHGVTGVRDMGGPLDQVLAWRESMRMGRTIGPRAVVSGPHLDGRPPVPEGSIVVGTPEEARRAVDSLADAGVDFIKAYEMLRQDAFLAVVETARRRGLAVAAHLPLAVDAFEASSAGVASLEHLRNLELACSARADSLRVARIARLDSSTTQAGGSVRGRIYSEQRPIALDTEDAARCDSVLRTLARHRTWQVPTLFQAEAPLLLTDTTAMRRILAAEPYVPREVASGWRSQHAAVLASPSDSRAPHERRARWLCALIPRLRDAGVPLLAGTDMPGNLAAPGFSLHEELRALRDAGLSNLEALRSATLGPARFLGADSLGSVEPGKVADLVLLDADPLANIANASRIRAVVIGGRMLDRSALDGLLEEAKRLAASSRP